MLVYTWRVIVKSNILFYRLLLLKSYYWGTKHQIYICPPNKINLTHDIQFFLLLRSPPKQQDWIPMHLCSWVPNNVAQQTQLTGRVELQLMVSTQYSISILFTQENITQRPNPDPMLIVMRFSWQNCFSLSIVTEPAFHWNNLMF